MFTGDPRVPSLFTPSLRGDQNKSQTGQVTTPEQNTGPEIERPSVSLLNGEPVINIPGVEIVGQKAPWTDEFVRIKENIYFDRNAYIRYRYQNAKGWEKIERINKKAFLGKLSKEADDVEDLINDEITKYAMISAYNNEVYKEAGLVSPKGEEINKEFEKRYGYPIDVYKSNVVDKIIYNVLGLTPDEFKEAKQKFAEDVDKYVVPIAVIGATILTAGLSSSMAAAYKGIQLAASTSLRTKLIYQAAGFLETMFYGAVADYFYFYFGGRYPSEIFNIEHPVKKFFADFLVPSTFIATGKIERTIAESPVIEPVKKKARSIVGRMGRKKNVENVTNEIVDDVQKQVEEHVKFNQELRRLAGVVDEDVARAADEVVETATEATDNVAAATDNVTRNVENVTENVTRAADEVTESVARNVEQGAEEVVERNVAETTEEVVESVQRNVEGSAEPPRTGEPLVVNVVDETNREVTEHITRELDITIEEPAVRRQRERPVHDFNYETEREFRYQFSSTTLDGKISKQLNKRGEIKLSDALKMIGKEKYGTAKVDALKKTLAEEYGDQLPEMISFKELRRLVDKTITKLEVVSYPDHVLLRYGTNYYDALSAREVFSYDRGGYLQGSFKESILDKLKAAKREAEEQGDRAVAVNFFRKVRILLEILRDFRLEYKKFKNDISRHVFRINETEDTNIAGESFFSYLEEILNNDGDIVVYDFVMRRITRENVERAGNGDIHVGIKKIFEEIYSPGENIKRLYNEIKQGILYDRWPDRSIMLWGDKILNYGNTADEIADSIIYQIAISYERLFSYSGIPMNITPEQRKRIIKQYVASSLLYVRSSMDKFVDNPNQRFAEVFEIVERKLNNFNDMEDILVRYKENFQNLDTSLAESIKEFAENAVTNEQKFFTIDIGITFDGPFEYITKISAKPTTIKTVIYFAQPEEASNMVLRNLRNGNDAKMTVMRMSAEMDRFFIDPRQHRGPREPILDHESAASLERIRQEFYNSDSYVFMFNFDRLKNLEETNKSVRYFLARIFKEVSGGVFSRHLHGHRINVASADIKMIGLTSDKFQDLYMIYNENLNTHRLRQSTLAHFRYCIHKFNNEDVIIQFEGQTDRFQHLDREDLERLYPANPELKLLKEENFRRSVFELIELARKTSDPKKYFIPTLKTHLGSQFHNELMDELYTSLTYNSDNTVELINSEYEKLSRFKASLSSSEDDDQIRGLCTVAERHLNNIRTLMDIFGEAPTVEYINGRPFYSFNITDKVAKGADVTPYRGIAILVGASGAIRMFVDGEEITEE